MPKLSKRRKAFLSLIEKGKEYPLKEAILLLKQAPTVKFDQTVEVSVKLDVDPKQSDQMVRGTVSLPHGTGKKIRVACFCKEDQQAKAKEAGADVVGATDLIEKVKGGTIDFDIAIATPNMMKDVAALGKILGPRGLMPNPKAGTVTDDIAKTIREVKKGRVEFKMDKQADIHLAVGKISFEEKAISENVTAFYEGLLKVRPASAKGHYIKSIALSSTMGPGMKLDLSTFKREV
ncbi:MAG: 50S ribosomal protein L1 [Candidatus Omnitrophica bacterium]|nr:50S ribosomal protein L1 [Candidatus Omnitrophota bacterium]